MDYFLSATKSRIKSNQKFEHVLGSITNEQSELNFEMIGIAPNTVKIGMMDVAYNMRRVVALRRISLSTR